MLWVNSNLLMYQKFFDIFRKTHDTMPFLDLSKVPSNVLVNEVDSIMSHHTTCCVFLGYLEPGWMLELTHQTRIRKLFRKFPVAMTTHFVESIPFSWKNEIDIYYTQEELNKDGQTNFVNNGSSLQE